MNKLWLTLILPLSITLLVAGCGSGKENASGSPNAQEQDTSSADTTTGSAAEAAAQTDEITLPQAQIPETVILDDENITATITGINYSYTYPLVTMTIANNRDSADPLLVQPRFAVNGCMTNHGYYLGDAISIRAGESSNYAFFLYDNQYYGLYPESTPIQSLDAAVYVEGNGESGRTLCALNGEPLTSDEQKMVRMLRSIGYIEYEQMQLDNYIYIPSISYESDYVHIDTDLADGSKDDTAAPADGAVLVDEAGCSIQYVDLIETQDGSYAYVFYVENTNDTAYTILCDDVSVNGTALSAHSSQFYLLDAADYISGYADEAGYPFELSMYLTNNAQRIAVGYNVPYTALTVAPQNSAYLIMPLDKNGLAIDGVSMPITSAEMTFSIAAGDGDPILCAAAVTADSSQAGLQTADVTRKDLEPGLSTWITNSTDYNYNLTDSIQKDETDSTDSAFLAAALHDIAAINIDEIDVTAVHKYDYSAYGDVHAQGDGYDGYHALDVHDGYARYWSMILYPDAEYGAAFSEDWVSDFKQALLDSGYTASSDTRYDKTTNDGNISVSISIYDNSEISIHASPVAENTAIIYIE